MPGKGPWKKDGQAGREVPGMPALWLLLIVFLLALLVRIPLALHDLPYYSIDENDVVELSHSFVAGEWDPHWYKYGPLFSYLLAIIFTLFKWFTSLVLGWTTTDYLSRVFFDPASFYFIARMMHGLVILASAWMMVRFAARYFNSRVALIALLLGTAPVADLATQNAFTVRIDTVQGLFSLAAIYFAAGFSPGKSGRRVYMLSGLMAGLCIAAKPLQGILVLPTLFLGHLLATRPGDGGPFLGDIGKRLLSRNWGTLLLGILISHSLANPYSILSFGAFFREQIEVVFSKAAQGGMTAGYDVAWFTDSGGWFLLVAVAAAVIAFIWRRDTPSRLLLAYSVTFCGAYLFFEVRPYWYNAVLPALLLMVAVSISDLTSWRRHPTRISPFITAVVITAALVAIPWARTVPSAIGSWRGNPTVEKRADRAAQRWIEANIHAGSRLLCVGWYAIDLPRLVATPATDQARWGEHFMYNRDRNVSWIEEFSLAYDRYSSEGGLTYRIVNIRAYYQDDPKYSPEVRGMMRNLPAAARKIGYNFIVTASPDGYEGPWESREGVQLIARFSPDQGYRGDEVKIFVLR
ncbi:MAG: hypothetical protein P1S46_11530 [bacterium]|nr:hypothetical protein [bacterium]